MKKFIILSAAILAACAGPVPEGGIEISNIRFDSPLPGQMTGVGFMSVENKGAADRLIAVSTPVSERVELHTHTEENGVMKMRRVDGIDLPAGETVEFKPGSYHIMIFGTEMAVGEETTVTLDFEKAEDVTLVAPILQRGAKPTMSDHSDHGSDTEY